MKYLVTVRSQYPSYNEKPGTMEVEADSKSKAIRTAKQEWERDGAYFGGGSEGRAIFSAKAVEDGK